jgi:hypothetical protein
MGKEEKYVILLTFNVNIMAYPHRIGISAKDIIIKKIVHIWDV